MNHFEIFLDKIYAFYHQSPKNQRDLKTCAAELDVEIIKIGRVFGPRWAACSLRTSLAVWKNYPALCKHFESNEKTSGLLNRLLNLEFLKDLALMIDILQAFAYLSEALQSRNIHIVKANTLISRTINEINYLKDSVGCYEAKIEDMLKTKAFEGLKIESKNKYMKLPREKLLTCIVSSLKERLLSQHNVNNWILRTEDNKFISDEEFKNIFNVCYPEQWQMEEVLSPWQEGEKRIKTLSFILKCDINVNEFREFVEAKLLGRSSEIPSSIKRARNIIETIAISSAEAERAFSAMNNIATEKRTALTVKHIADFMTIVLNGKPLDQFDPNPYLKSFLRNHQSAIQPPNRKSTANVEKEEYSIWRLLE